jgi:hypothetical protein
VAATQATQLSQAATSSGRAALVKSLVAGATVQWDDDNNPATPNKSTNFRINLVNLLYLQLVGRAATTAEMTAGKTLMAKPLAASSLQGSEWVVSKIMSSPEYFSIPANVQAEGLPDDGLHTQRSWVDGVARDRFHRAQVAGHYATTAERDTYSQKILNNTNFQKARVTLEKAIVNSTEYRAIQITNYYHVVFGPTRIVTSTEMSTWQTNLKNGQTFTTLVSNLLGSNEYYADNTNPNDTVAQQKKEWADAVYNTLLSRAPTPAEETALINAITSNTPSGRQSASLKVLNSTDATNGPTWRDKLITAAFNLLLNHSPSAAELLAYETFLKTNRWEALYPDIMAANLAINETPASLGRQFWEIDN